MTPERWQQVKSVFDQALELAPGERIAFLDRACSTDHSLRREVESLLSSGEDACSGFLEPGSTCATAREGTRLGIYEVQSLLGSGGMGVVYRSIRADGQYKQQVALKIVRADLGAEFMSERFRNERQILASLDHPNIAKILDAGTTPDGLPYFVMEFIDGLSITEYCDQQQLTIDARLRLFRTVCSAVHHAHQHLVIHRDLKPGNILITSEGIPKLLDFGIAKILDQNLLPENVTLTAGGPWLMTPEYASPEQFRGESITTATDVYSLGLILYELLSGHRAYRITSRMPHEIARAVLETDPEKPSTAVRRRLASSGGPAESAAMTPELVSNLRGDLPERLQRRLSGDLDNIVLKALRKEPAERYASVDQFSEDIRRHLDSLPVLARKSTVAYRCRKYVLRHKAAVAAAAVVLVSLLSGMALTVRQYRIARANQLRAERRLDQTRELTETLIGELSNATGNGITPARVLMQQKAVEYLERVVREENTNHGVKIALARSYEGLGEALANPGFGNMGDLTHGLENFERAIPLFEEELAADPGNTPIRLDLRGAYTEKALALGWTDISTGLQTHRKALALLAAENPNVDPMLDALGWEYDLIGQTYGDPYFPNLGDTSHALEYLQKSVSLAEMWYRTRPETDYSSHLYYAASVDMAAVLWARGHTAEALNNQLHGEAILNADSSRSQSVPNRLITNWAPQSQVVREERGMAMVRRANLLADAGRLSEAQAVLGESRGILETLLATDPMNYALRRDLTRNYNLTGNLLTRTGNVQAGLEIYRKALPLTTELLRVQPNQPDAQQHLADTYEGMGNTLSAMGRASEALENVRNALAIRESLAKLDPNDARYKFSLAKNYVSLGNVLERAHHHADAISNYRLAVGIERSLAAGDPFNALVARDLADTHRKLHALSTPEQANHH